MREVTPLLPLRLDLTPRRGTLARRRRRPAWSSLPSPAPGPLRSPGARATRRAPRFQGCRAPRSGAAARAIRRAQAAGRIAQADRAIAAGFHHQIVEGSGQERCPNGCGEKRRSARSESGRRSPAARRSPCSRAPTSLTTSTTRCGATSSWRRSWCSTHDPSARRHRHRLPGILSSPRPIRSQAEHPPFL